MEDPHFSYDIFRGSNGIQQGTEVHSRAQVLKGLPKSKECVGVGGADLSKKPLSDVGNTLANLHRCMKSLPEASAKASVTQRIYSLPELQENALSDCSYQNDEVFLDEVEVQSVQMSNLDLSLDPLPEPIEDNYEDILPSHKDVSTAAIRRMVFLWNEFDIPYQSSWNLPAVDSLASMPDSPEKGHLLNEELFPQMEIPLPEPVPLFPLASF